MTSSDQIEALRTIGELVEAQKPDAVVPLRQSGIEQTQTHTKYDKLRRRSATRIFTVSMW